LFKRFWPRREYGQRDVCKILGDHCLKDLSANTILDGC
jgi:hypothetical protein